LLSLLNELREAALEPQILSYTAGTRACGIAEQWQQAMSLFVGSISDRSAG